MAFEKKSNLILQRKLVIAHVHTSKEIAAVLCAHFFVIITEEDEALGATAEALKHTAVANLINHFPPVNYDSRVVIYAIF